MLFHRSLCRRHLALEVLLTIVISVAAFAVLAWFIFNFSVKHDGSCYSEDRRRGDHFSQVYTRVEKPELTAAPIFMNGAIVRLDGRSV